MTNYPDACAIIDDLVAMFTTLESDTVAVSDGILIGREERKVILEVGVDDPDSIREASWSSASSTIEWAGLGNRARDESVLVNCAISAWTGTTVAKEARDAANAVLAGAAQLLFTNYNDVGTAWAAWISQIDWSQGQTDKGAMAVCLFSITARVRLSV